jgi:hypothetical protein
MKKIYLRAFLTSTFTLLFFLSCFKATAQCPYGQPGGNTAFDTTIIFGSGIVSTEVKFPKFDPQNGMVTCVRLCVTIRGIIDTVALENFTNAAQTGSYTYKRRDTIRGPGIPTFLTSAPTNLNFGLFPLAATNGVFGSGPDFYSNGSDTILTKVLCSNISDSTTITQFYGVNDSVTYNYAIDADAVGIVTGGSSLAFVLSSALVNFHFEYCTCPSTTLPLSVRDLLVTKLANNKAELSWDGNDDQSAAYRYVIEMSKDGKSFSSIGELPRNANNNDELYKFIYTTRSTESGMFFFRVKQLYSNGYTRFSNVKQIYLENSPSPKFTVFPNPSDGIVGIKFDNIESGKMTLQVFNSRGQKVLQKDILVAGSSYQQIGTGTLESGVYWIKVADEKNRLSFVSQLLIK